MLLEDYKISIDFIFHEDRRKADLFKIFTFAEGLFFTFFNVNFGKNVALCRLIAAFAFFFSLYWSLVMEKMRAVIKAKNLYILHLEKKLVPISGVSVEREAKFRRYQMIGNYRFNAFQRISVSKSESILPVFIALFWVALFFVVP